MINEEQYFLYESFIRQSFDEVFYKVINNMGKITKY